MRYLLCPCCYSNLIRIQSNIAFCLNKQEQLECLRCKTRFPFELAITDSDKIVPVILKKQSDISNWMNFLFEIAQGDTIIEKDMSIEVLVGVCNDCENLFLIYICKNITCIIDYPFSTSIILKINRNKIVKKCFKLILVFPKSNCMFPANLNQIDEFLRYTYKLAVFRHNETALHDSSDSYIEILTILANRFRTFQNLSRARRVTQPIAIVSLHKSISAKEDIHFIDCLSSEYQNWETFTVTDNKVSLFKDLFLWIIK